MRQSLLVLVSTLLVIMLACASDITDQPAFEGELNLVGLIISDGRNSSSNIHLYKSWKISEVNPETISGASVYINDGAQSVMLSERIIDVDNILASGEGNYFDKNKELHIEPSSTYEVFVEYNEISIHGTSVMPGYFQITRPSEGKRLSIQSGDFIHIEWTKANSSGSWLVSAKGTLSYRQYASDISLSSVRVDGQSYDFDTVRFFDVSHDTRFTGEIVFYVAAIDSNYHDFLYTKPDRSGIDQGFGLFGSAVVESVKVFFNGN